MQAFLRSGVTAIISALCFFTGSIYVLMEIGLARYDNYEYYGKYPALYVVPPLIGFFLPSLLARVLRGANETEDEAAG